MNQYVDGHISNFKVKYTKNLNANETASKILNNSKIPVKFRNKSTVFNQHSAEQYPEEHFKNENVPNHCLINNNFCNMTKTHRASQNFMSSSTLKLDQNYTERSKNHSYLPNSSNQNLVMYDRLQEKNGSGITGDADVVFQLTKRMSDINDSYKIHKVSNQYKTLGNFGKSNNIRRNNQLRLKQKNKLSIGITKNHQDIQTDRTNHKSNNKFQTYRQNATNHENYLERSQPYSNSTLRREPKLFDNLNVRKTMIHQLNYNDFIHKEKGSGQNNFVQYKNKLEYQKNNGIDIGLLNKLIEEEKLEYLDEGFTHESKNDLVQRQNLPNYKTLQIENSPMNTYKYFKIS